MGNTLRWLRTLKCSLNVSRRYCYCRRCLWIDDCIAIKNLLDTFVQMEIFILCQISDGKERDS